MADKHIFYVTRMFRGGQKSDGWFGCFAQVRGIPYEVKVTGKSPMMRIEEGMELSAVLEQVQYRSYKASDITPVITHEKGIVSYFSSSNFPGVGPGLAKRLYKEYGKDVFQEIENHSSEVQTRLCLTDEQIRTLYDGVVNRSVENQLQIWLPELTERMIKLIMQKWDNPISVIKKDPYQLCEINGISFRRADRIAVDFLNVGRTSLRRIESGLLYWLRHEMSGHLYVNLSDDTEFQRMTMQLSNMLTIAIDLVQMKDYLDTIQKECHSVVVIQEYGEYHLYEAKTRVAEDDIVRHVVNADKYYTVDDAFKEKVRLAIRNTVSLSDEQQKAVYTALTNPVSVITGGPGRGKTYVIKAIADIYSMLFQNTSRDDIVLLAPTGKAANKLKQDTGRNVQTVARFIYIARKMRVNAKLEVFNSIASGIFIVDEASMLGIKDAAALLQFVRGPIVFVGDVDQLPPIEAGAFFKDMIRSGVVPTAYLTKSYRTGVQTLLENADAINAGNTKLKMDMSFMVIPQVADDATYQNYIILTYKNLLLNCDIKDVAVLCPVNKGMCGVRQLNLVIQNLLNPEVDKPASIARRYDSVREVHYFDYRGFALPGLFYNSDVKGLYTRYRIGDRVMQIENKADVEWDKYSNRNYMDKPTVSGCGVYNGDCGTIVRYDVGENGESAIVWVEMDDGRVIRVAEERFGDMVMCYAMSVHKSQGSEYKHVIYSSPFSLQYTHPGFLCRNLLYTAVTRAQETVMLIGSKDMIYRSIQLECANRNSVTARRLKDTLTYSP